MKTEKKNTAKNRVGLREGISVDGNFHVIFIHLLEEKKKKREKEERKQQMLFLNYRFITRFGFKRCVYQFWGSELKRNTHISSLTFAIRVILNSISATPPTGIRSLPVQKRNSFRFMELENFPTVSQKYLHRGMKIYQNKDHLMSILVCVTTSGSLNLTL
jgi:hypothetical protein